LPDMPHNLSKLSIDREDTTTIPDRTRHVLRRLWSGSSATSLLYRLTHTPAAIFAW